MQPGILNALATRLQDLIKTGQPLFFDTGQVLFYEGHSPLGLFVLMWGTVEFKKVGERPCEEAPCKSEHGSILGLEPFLLQRPYCCTALATSPCQAVFISRIHFDHCIREKTDKNHENREGL